MNKFSMFLKTSLVEPFIRSFSRFPDTMVLTILIVITSYFNNEPAGPGILLYVLRAMWLALPLMIFKNLLLERFKWPSYLKYVLTGVVVIISVGYFFLAPLDMSEDIILFRYFSLLLMFALFAFSIAYFSNRKNFAIYLAYLMSKFFATVFYSAVLYGGLSAILGTIDGLFNVNIEYQIYLDMLISVVGFMAIPVGLGFIPKQSDELDLEHYHKVWKTVFSFIILPLVVIFGLILFVYLVTSTINTNYYPDVYLASCLGMAIVGIGMIVILEPFDDVTHIKLFRKWFPIMVLTLFIGFYVELVRQIIIDGFDFTASLYLYSSIWVVVNSLLIFIKPKRALFSIGQRALWSLTDIVFLIAVFPFLNSYSIERYHLNNQLETVLTDLNMLNDGLITPRTDLTNEEKGQLSSLIYECASIGFQRIEILPDDFSLETFTTVFGFDPTYYYENNDLVFINYGLSTPGTDLSILLSHEVLLDITALVSESKALGDYDYIYQSEGFIWELSKLDVVLLELDIKAAILDIYETIGADADPALSDLHYSGANADITYDVYFKDIYAQYNTSTTEFTLGGASFFVGFTFIV